MSQGKTIHAGAIDFRAGRWSLTDDGIALPPGAWARTHRRTLRHEGRPVLALTQGRLAEAVDALEATPEVLEVDAVSGPEDLICRVAARNPEHLQDIVNRLLATDAIRHSTSYVVLSRPIRPRVQPLVDAVGAPSKLPASSKPRRRAARDAAGP